MLPQGYCHVIANPIALSRFSILRIVIILYIMNEDNSFKRNLMLGNYEKVIVGTKNKTWKPCTERGAFKIRVVIGNFATQSFAKN
jgi:hypothetical protein